MTRDDRVLPGPLLQKPSPELSRRFALARIGESTRMVIEARPEECRALAERLGLEAIHALSCPFDLRRGECQTVAAAGLLQARIRQICVVSLEPFDSEVVEDFTIRFVPAGTESDDLDLETDDEVPYEGGVLELGEAISEQLALILDPFPRKVGAELPAPACAGEGGAFAHLAGLFGDAASE